MLQIRRDADIYAIDGEWFRARWHFSFDQYHDPANDSFGAMRVFNDDRLIPGAVWPLHPTGARGYRGLCPRPEGVGEPSGFPNSREGITYVVEGTFGHEDNVGGAFGPLPAGSVQQMTLGSGALHSERNASATEPMRFIQIWILPDTAGLTPEVEQRIYTREDRTNRLLQVIGPPGSDAVTVHQDAAVYVASLDPDTEVTHQLGDGRGAYAYLIDGAATFDDEPVSTGDAAKVTDQPTLRIRARDHSELILVDIPMHFEAVGVWRGRA